MSNAAASGNVVTPPPRSPRECHGNLRHHRHTGGGMADLHRLIRNAFWFCFGVLLVGVPMLAFAESQPASMVTYWKMSYSIEKGQSQEDVCRAYASANGYRFDKVTLSTCHAYNPPSAAYSTNFPMTYYQDFGCPDSSWTLSGQTCTRSDCPAGTDRQPDGTCKTSCSASGASGAASGQSFTGSGSAPSTICVSGCLYNINIAVGLGGKWSATAGSSAGQTCTTNNSTGTPPDDPRTKCVEQGMTFGTVNGQVVCTAPTSTQTIQYKTTQNPDGTSTTYKIVTTTTCNGSDCTKTTTTTVVGGGSGSGSGTGTGTGHQY